MTEVIFGTDLHGDMRDKTASDSFLRFCETRPNSIRVFGGDVFDFRAIRSGATKDQKRESMRKDFNAGIEFLERMRPHVVLRGNHDERLWNLARSRNGPLADYAVELIERFDGLLGTLQARSLPYHKSRGVYRIGNLSFVHGYFHGEQAARKHAQVYRECIFGHCHTVDSATVPGITSATAYGVGSLCKNDFDYNSTTASSLRHENGWAVVHMWGRKGHAVSQVKRIVNKFAIPGETSLV